MPYSYSNASMTRLMSCDTQLQELFNTVIVHWDTTIVEGHRDQAAQEEMFRTGKSQLRWPQSKHNSFPSRAVDAAPYYAGEGIPWDDRERFMAFGNFVLGVASNMGINLRWGGDWDGDRTYRDQSFHDLPHFELRDS